jgi:hypothetical protein
VATATPGGERVEIESQTAIPGNDETAIARAIVATAFARTTGTYTPTPRGVVVIFPTATPFVIDPSELATVTPIPPDTDLLTIPINYELCGCRGLIIAQSDQFDKPRSGPILLDANGTVLGRFDSDLTYNLALAREAYSPDRTKRIVYAPGVRGIQQVGYEDLVTGEVTILTEFTRGVAYDAAWSPDGSAIAFVSTERANTDEIYIYDFGTETITRITDATGLGQPWSKRPTWSPDSQQIAFWSSRSGNDQIWVMNRDGTNLRNISNNSFRERDPVWVK